MTETLTKKAQEIWEVTTEGATYVNVHDPRVAGAWIQKKVGGGGSKRITITVDEREFNQELIAYENQDQDAFSNGLLVRIMPKDTERTRFERTDAELTALLEDEDDDSFANLIAGI